MTRTVIADWIGQEKVGYWVGFFLSPENRQKVADLQARLETELPGIIWPTHGVNQQITLFAIVIRSDDSPEDRDAIFERHRASIDAELKAQLAMPASLSVSLDILEASSSAIILRGTDDGSLQHIRNAVSGKHLLPEGARMPQDIIHSPLAHYLQEVDLDHVRSVVARHRLKLTQTVTEFEMVKISQPRWIALP